MYVPHCGICTQARGFEYPIDNFQGARVFAGSGDIRKCRKMSAMRWMPIQNPSTIATADWPAACPFPKSQCAVPEGFMAWLSWPGADAVREPVRTGVGISPIRLTDSRDGALIYGKVNGGAKPDPFLRLCRSAKVTRPRSGTRHRTPAPGYSCFHHSDLLNSSPPGSREC